MVHSSWAHCLHHKHWTQVSFDLGLAKGSPQVRQGHSSSSSSSLLCLTPLPFVADAFAFLPFPITWPPPFPFPFLLALHFLFQRWHCLLSPPLCFGCLHPILVLKQPFPTLALPFEPLPFAPLCFGCLHPILVLKQPLVGRCCKQCGTLCLPLPATGGCQFGKSRHLTISVAAESFTRDSKLVAGSQKRYIPARTEKVTQRPQTMGMA